MGILPRPGAHPWFARRRLGSALHVGAGPRVCIGNSFAMMGARLVLATQAGRVRLQLEPDAQLQRAPLITLRPRAAMHMRVFARELATERLLA